MTYRVALAGLAFSGVLVGAPRASASCLPSTRAELQAKADVIFDGVALESPTATGVQRFRVVRYRKGHGPSVLRVQTGTSRYPDGSGATSSVAILVRRGERWRIFARGRARRVLRTSVCDGSRRL